MNFDPERVLALAKIFDFPRAVNTLGEQRAADLIAEEFQRAGLRVERLSIRHAETQLLFWLVTALFLWLGTARAFSDASLAVRLVLMTVGMMGLVLASRVQLLLDRASLAIPREQIVGRWMCKSPPPVRIIVFTRHVTMPSRVVILEKTLLVILGGVFWLLLVGDSLWLALSARMDFEMQHWSRGAGIALLLGWWITSLLMIGLPERRGAARSFRRSGTGLAILTELSRTWPKGHGDRFEVLFVSTGGFLGSEILGESLRQGAAQRPILVINLDAPGLGNRLVFVGSKAGVALANEAARGLWLPHRVSRRRWESPLPGCFHGPGLTYVSVRGDQRSAPIDPAALNATAQLVMEMALRWAKQARKAREIHPLD